MNPIIAREGRKNIEIFTRKIKKKMLTRTWLPRMRNYPKCATDGQLQESFPLNEHKWKTKLIVTKYNIKDLR